MVEVGRRGQPLCACGKIERRSKLAFDKRPFVPLIVVTLTLECIAAMGEQNPNASD